MTIARIGKYIVPRPLRPRLREEYTYFVRKVFDRRVKKSRDQFLKEGTYLRWYAEQCDNDAKTNLATKNKIPARLDWMKAGVNQLNAAIQCGLQPQNTLLEFGCGFMRAGNHFIAYLDDETYTGNDASGERIKHGSKVVADIIGQDIYDRKNPHFYVNQDNSFDWAEGNKYDYIWSCSVLAHMPEDDIDDLFANIKKVMHENSMFLFTYSCAEIDKFRQWEHDSSKDRKKGIRQLVKKRNHMFIIRALEAGREEDCIEVDTVNWFHTFNFYQKLADKYGYEIEDVSGVLPKEDCIGFDYPSRLAKVTLKT